MEIAVLGDPRSSPASPLEPAIIDTVQQVVSSRYPGVPVIPVMYAAATNGVETRIAGIPTYGVRGVMHGVDDYRSHGRDGCRWRTFTRLWNTGTTCYKRLPDSDGKIGR